MWKVGGATVKLSITAHDLISFSSNSNFVFDILFHVVTFWVNFRDVGDATLTLIPDW